MFISKEEMQKDLMTVFEMQKKYHAAVWEPQEGQVDHFDNQPKIAKVALIDARMALSIAEEAISKALQVVQWK